MHGSIPRPDDEPQYSAVVQPCPPASGAPGSATSGTNKGAPSTNTTAPAARIVPHGHSASSEVSSASAAAHTSPASSAYTAEGGRMPIVEALWPGAGDTVETKTARGGKGTHFSFFFLSPPHTAVLITLAGGLGARSNDKGNGKGSTGGGGGWTLLTGWIKGRRTRSRDTINDSDDDNEGDNDNNNDASVGCCCWRRKGAKPPIALTPLADHQEYVLALWTDDDSDVGSSTSSG
ncbi:hypothetical protein DFH06DRAFT_1344054 [Mycena polygramma]|nr:hypothetical protein DFH06DRAFT_1344054 [Mycena polygramma]